MVEVRLALSRFRLHFGNFRGWQSSLVRMQKRLHHWYELILSLRFHDEHESEDDEPDNQSYSPLYVSHGISPVMGARPRYPNLWHLAFRYQMYTFEAFGTGYSIVA